MTLHGYITTEIIYSNAHTHPDVIAWETATFVHEYLYKPAWKISGCSASQWQIKPVCSSYGSSHFLPASRLTPCLSYLGSVISKTETHASILAWEIPRTEEPGGRQSTRSKRVGQDLETKQQQASVYLACLLFLYVYGTVGLKEGQFCFPSPAYLAMSGDVFGHHN